MSSGGNTVLIAFIVVVGIGLLINPLDSDIRGLWIGRSRLLTWLALPVFAAWLSLAGASPWAWLHGRWYEMEWYGKLIVVVFFILLPIGFVGARISLTVDVADGLGATTWGTFGRTLWRIALLVPVTLAAWLVGLGLSLLIGSRASIEHDPWTIMAMTICTVAILGAWWNVEFQLRRWKGRTPAGRGRGFSLDGLLDVGHRFGTFVQGLFYFAIVGVCLWFNVFGYAWMAGNWPALDIFSANDLPAMAWIKDAWILTLYLCAVVCLFFGLRAWRGAFKRSPQLDAFDGVHGSADYASEDEAARAARGQRADDSTAGLNLNY